MTTTATREVDVINNQTTSKVDPTTLLTHISTVLKPFMESHRVHCQCESARYAMEEILLLTQKSEKD